MTNDKSNAGDTHLLEQIDVRDGWEVEAKDSHFSLNYTAVPLTRLKRTMWPGIDATNAGSIWMMMSHDPIGDGFDREHAGIVNHGSTVDCTHTDDAAAAIEHGMTVVERAVGQELREGHKPRMLG